MRMTTGRLLDAATFFDASHFIAEVAEVAQLAPRAAGGEGDGEPERCGEGKLREASER